MFTIDDIFFYFKARNIEFTNNSQQFIISCMELNEEFPFGDKFDWKNKVFLGEGSYGKVYKVKNSQDGQYYAIKQMMMEQFNRDPTLMASLKGEIQITMDVNSDHTVKMLDAKIGKKYTYMILELCDTDLRKELASRKFTEPECVAIFEEIMIGFSVLVHKGYIHRDIKPANTLVKNHHYKVADFGFACKADILGRKKLTDICGTPIYMAPQLLKNEPYTAKSDIWSLGLMLYEMIFGYAPWPCRSLEEYLSGIYHKSLSFPYNAKIGENTKDFLLKSLVIDEDKRMSWEQVFQHPLIKRKEVGNEVKQVMVDPYTKKMLIQLQTYIIKYNVNWPQLTTKYSHQIIDQQVFFAVLKEINPLITTHEASTLFKFLDSSKAGVISWAVIDKNLLQVDYRNSEDVLSRKIDEVVAILRAQKADPIKIFQQIDVNHSGSLDFGEFSKFLATIAPCYTKEEVLQIFRLFDNDKNGLISKQEFLEFLTVRMPSHKQAPTIHTFQKERAARNLNQLIGYIKWMNISPDTILKMADSDGSHYLQFDEFSKFVRTKLNFNISEEEIGELFTVVNKSNDNKISLAELAAALK